MAIIAKCTRDISGFIINPCRISCGKRKSFGFHLHGKISLCRCFNLGGSAVVRGASRRCRPMGRKVRVGTFVDLPEFTVGNGSGSFKMDND